MVSSVLRLLLAMAFLLPLAVLLVWSVALRWPWPSLLPTVTTPRWWLELCRSSTLGALGESALLGVVATFVAVLLAVPLSLLLSRNAFRVKHRMQILELLVLAPLVVPPLSAALGLQEMLLRAGMPPSFTVVLAGHVVFILPYAVLLLREGWRGIPSALEDQARLLGATAKQVFLYVALPLLTPSMLLAAGFGFIVSLSQYLPTLLLGGGQVNTLCTILLPVIRNGERGPAAVLATVFVLVALGFCLLLRRFSRHFSLREPHE